MLQKALWVLCDCGCLWKLHIFIRGGRQIARDSNSVKMRWTFIWLQSFRWYNLCDMQLHCQTDETPACEYVEVYHIWFFFTLWYLYQDICIHIETNKYTILYIYMISLTCGFNPKVYMFFHGPVVVYWSLSKICQNDECAHR